MAPKFAPKVWKRPYTSIYNDNYRYGNSLYSEQISDIERKYNEAIANTRLRFDRPDIGLSTFSDSQLTGESALAKHRSAVAKDNLTDERIRSFSSTRVHSYLDDSDRKLAPSASFDTYNSQRVLDKVSSEIEESRLRRSGSRRSIRRPDSAIYSSPSTVFESSVLQNGTNDNGPSQSFWTERCRELQNEVEQLKQELHEANEKVKHDSSLVKNKINQEIGDLMIAIDDQDRQIGDLQKMLRKQAKQISDISLELGASQRQYTDVNETLAQSQKRCLNLVHEIEDMRANLEKQHIFTTLANEVSKIPPPQSMIPAHYNARRDPRFLLD